MEKIIKRTILLFVLIILTVIVTVFTSNIINKKISHRRFYIESSVEESLFAFNASYYDFSMNSEGDFFYSTREGWKTDRIIEWLNKKGYDVDKHKVLNDENVRIDVIKKLKKEYNQEKYYNIQNIISDEMYK